jgi:hypothetical protein
MHYAHTCRRSAPGRLCMPCKLLLVHTHTHMDMHAGAQRLEDCACPANYYFSTSMPEGGDSCTYKRGTASAPCVLCPSNSYAGTISVCVCLCACACLDCIVLFVSVPKLSAGTAIVCVCVCVCSCVLELNCVIYISAQVPHMRILDICS